MKERGFFEGLVEGVGCALPTEQFCPTDRFSEPANRSVGEKRLPKSERKLPRGKIGLSGHGTLVRY